MNQRLRTAPVWLMGLGNCIFGFYVGLVGISLPQLLSTQHLPESQVASITAWVFSPWCWIFLLSPILDGLGEDYHAPMRLVSLVGGGGVILAGVVGSLIYPVFGRRIALRPLYLLIGITGAVFTLIVLILPKNSFVFALALIGETTFQALAVTGAFAIRALNVDIPGL
jgi:hypothetical protein